MIQRVSLWWLVLCLLAACGSSPSSPSDGTTASTAGQQCEKIMNAFCTHASNDCKLTGTVADCVNQGITACCQGKCNTTALSSDASIDTCVSAMTAMSCADATAGNAPDVCKGAVKFSASFTPPGVGELSIGSQISSSVE